MDDGLLQARHFAGLRSFLKALSDMYTMLTLGALPDGLIAAVAGFVGLDFLRIRRCSRKFLDLDGPCLRRTLQLDRLAEGLAICHRMSFYGIAWWASKRGYLPWVQWGVVREKHNDKDMHHFVCLILDEACRGGYLSIVQWLVMYFDLKARDLRSYHFKSLQVARDAGFDELVSWMTAYFKLGTGLAFGLSLDAVEASTREARTARA